MSSTSTITTHTTIRHLRELIAALDWRLPQVERIGEAAIAQDAALLRNAAVRRIAELELELTMTVDRRASDTHEIAITHAPESRDVR